MQLCACAIQESGLHGRRRLTSEDLHIFVWNYAVCVCALPVVRKLSIVNGNIFSIFIFLMTSDMYG